MNLNKQRNPNAFEKFYNKLGNCSVSKASNEIMLHRISGGRDIEFPFCTSNKE